MNSVQNFAGLDGFTLRDYTPRDLEAYVDLGLPTCAFMHGRPEISPEVMRRDFASFLREYAFDGESEILLVESPQRQLAGQLWLHTTINRFNSLKEMWIWDITVHSNYRRRGLGRALIRVAIQRAIELDCRELWLLVSSRNESAISLYQTEGLSVGGHLMKLCLGATQTAESCTLKVGMAELKPLDLSQITSLYKLWEVAELPYKPQGRDRADRLARHFGRAWPGGYAAYVGQKLVSAALISSDGRKGYVERLATHPDYRRGGLAKAVVTACMKSLRERGIQIIAALVEYDNYASRRLFESCGFSFQESICYYTNRQSPDN